MQRREASRSPVQFPTKFEMVVNAETATALGRHCHPYETPFDFAELYRAYVEPRPAAAAAPAPAAKKRKSR
jgi:hypothetical protein